MACIFKQFLFAFQISPTKPRSSFQKSGVFILNEANGAKLHANKRILNISHFWVRSIMSSLLMLLVFLQFVYSLGQITLPQLFANFHFFQGVNYGRVTQSTSSQIKPTPTAPRHNYGYKMAFDNKENKYILAYLTQQLDNSNSFQYFEQMSNHFRVDI